MGGWGNLRALKKNFSVLCISIIFTFMIIIEVSPAVAQTQEYEFNIIEGEDINTDPTAKHILAKIELSKKILADLQTSNMVQLTEHQKFVEEQRKIVKAQLQVKLDRMNKKYEDHTPRNAFTSYVSDKPDYMKSFYWDQFNYLDNKVSLAKKQRDLVLHNGGTYEQAQQAFIQSATFPKSEVESVFYQLVEKHDLYDNYAGEIDPDKWYPQQAIELFESWNE
jgi:exopolysaccharide biosynthesis protein